jgi:hypothetical protein
VQKTLLMVALITGLLIAYVDSRPSWDDTGITVFGLLLSAAIIGLFVRRRPWCYGLAVGAWIPVYQLYQSHDFRFVLVLIFPMAGLYIGWGLRTAVLRWRASGRE